MRDVGLNDCSIQGSHLLNLHHLSDLLGAQQDVAQQIEVAFFSDGVGDLSLDERSFSNVFSVRLH